MATVPSIKVLKTFDFKGGSRIWSNRYYFGSGSPTDQTHWHTMMDNIVTAEKAILVPSCTIIECLGYDAGSDIPVSTKTYSTAGTVTGSANSVLAPGEVVALGRWSTAARSVRNHPIYAFSYWHGVYVDGQHANTIDQLDVNPLAAMQTYANHWVTGFSDGTVTHVRNTQGGHVVTGYVIEEYVTHRDFPYTRSL